MVATKDVRRAPKDLLVILAIALALRVAWVVYAAREPANFGDPFIYMALARRIAAGNGYGPLFSFGPTAFHPPGYPGWLAGIVWSAKRVGLETHEPKVVGLLQALLGTASVALVFAIARTLFTRRVALIAGALAACFPNLIFYSALLYSETLYTFGVLLAVWIVVRADWKPVPSTRVLVAFGLVVGLSSLVRPFALLALIALAVALVRAGSGWRDAARQVGIVGGIVVLLLVPWTIRNAFAYHAFVPFSTNLGDTLCLDNSPGAYGGFRELPPECSPAPPPQRITAYFEEPRTGEDEAKHNSHNLRYAVSWAVHNPGREAVLVFRRAFYGYRNDHDALTDPTGPNGNFPPAGLRRPFGRVADAYYYAVLALGVAGAFKFRGDPRRTFVLAVAVSIAAVPLFLYGLIRFHIPLLPFLAIGAAVSIDRIRPAPEPTVSPRSDGTA